LKELKDLNLNHSERENIDNNNYDILNRHNHITNSVKIEKI